MAKRELTGVALKAKEMRKELKKTFPRTKFSVRSSNFSGGSSIDIRWTDFPTVEAVREVTRKYESLHRDHATGEILLGANDYVSEDQTISDELKEKATKRMPEDIKNENALTKQYWLNETIKEMYEEVKNLYQGEHLEKQGDLAKKRKSPEPEVKEENREKPATKKQLWALHCITGMNTKEWNITRSKASELIKMKDSNIDINIAIKEANLVH